MDTNNNTTTPKIRHVGFTFSLPQTPHSQMSQPQQPHSLSTPVPVPPAPISTRRENFSPPPHPPPPASTSPSNSESSDGWLRSSSGKYGSTLAFDMSGVNSPVAQDHHTNATTNTNNNDHENDHQHEAEEAEAVVVDVSVDHHHHQTEKSSKMSEAQTLQDRKSTSKPLKEKTSKAERRAMQEAQRAAKVVKKAEASGVNTRDIEKPAKVPKQLPHKKHDPISAPSSTVSETKGGDRVSERDKKKDLHPPRMQYDDKNKVDKAKKRSVVKQTEAKNRVELFSHLPQYEYGTQLPDLQSKIFNLDLVHPAVYKVGLHHLAGDIFGSNARCISMLLAFRESIKDYQTPPEKTLNRDLTVRISSYISFLNECRPLSISMGNAIRFLKSRIAKLPLSLSESEAIDSLCSDIDRFITEKIVIADKVIVEHAATKVKDGDVLLVYGASGVVEMALVRAYELGKQFRVVIVDSRPKLEGQALLRRLVMKGLNCTYTHINAVSYVMHEVTKVLLGAAAVLSNGTVYSRIGTACVAMVANAFRVPVLVCCEAYKFHERVQLDSICVNELGDPNAISRVHGRKDVKYLDNWFNKGNLQLLNLLYDATPADYVSLIVTDYGMVPPTSVPVIVREYGKEYFF